MKAKEKIEVVDKNGNRRAYCDSEAEAERVIKSLDKQKPGFKPFSVKDDAD